MKQIKTLVVDESKNSRTIIIEVLKKYCGNIKLVGEAENLIDANQAIIIWQPDLVLLNYEIPNGNAADLLKKTENKFDVIVTTAYKENAKKAIAYGALGYLLKPISIDELINVIKKVTMNKCSKNNFS